MEKDIIFESVVGSQAYGLAIPTSDIDFKGVYIDDLKTIGFAHSTRQIQTRGEHTYFELGRFAELLCSANPTVLEMLYVPEECITYCHPAFRELIDNRHLFLTKKCRDSFGGYAVQQIKKAKGKDKKANWEHRKVSKKDILDFCCVYSLDNLDSYASTIPLKRFCKERGDSIGSYGLSKLKNMKDTYLLFYDSGGGKFRGLIKNKEHTQLRISSIPKGYRPVGILNYNSQGFEAYSREYNHYVEWLEHKNEERYIETPQTGERINAKNLMHCRRLIETAKEIATRGVLVVQRSNREELLAIREGKVTLNDLITQSEQDIKDLDSLFMKSGLPEEVDIDRVREIIYNIRKNYF